VRGAPSGRKARPGRAGSRGCARRGRARTRGTIRNGRPTTATAYPPRISRRARCTSREGAALPRCPPGPPASRPSPAPPRPAPAAGRDRPRLRELDGDRRPFDTRAVAAPDLDERLQPLLLDLEVDRRAHRPASGPGPGPRSEISRPPAATRRPSPCARRCRAASRVDHGETKDVRVRVHDGLAREIQPVPVSGEALVSPARRQPSPRRRNRAKPRLTGRLAVHAGAMRTRTFPVAGSPSA